MTSKDVIDFYKKADKLGIRFWIDGGWATDALLGQQTREHKDIDIAINNDDVLKLLEMLAEEKYKEIRRDSEWNFVVRDEQGREIDVHAFIADKDGNITGGIMYPKESLTGTAAIDGHSVRCIAPKYLIEFIVG